MKTDATAERPAALLPEALTAKLNDLDGLVLALSQGVPANKPRGRQLQTHLRQADTCIEVLRLTLLLHRPLDEIAAAAGQVRAIVAAMDAATAGGRADVTTRSALRLMHRLAQELDRHFQGLATPEGTHPPGDAASTRQLER